MYRVGAAQYDTSMRLQDEDGSDDSWNEVHVLRGTACDLIGKSASLQTATALHGWVADLSLNLGIILR